MEKYWVLSDLFQVFKNKPFFYYALWIKILILYFHPSVGQFIMGSCFLKFDLIVKVCQSLLQEEFILNYNY
jgi:hypothetical protein